jgi:hypothetical protein
MEILPFFYIGVSAPWHLSLRSMSTSKAISRSTMAFANPHAPPRPLIVLLAHTDMFGGRPRTPLLAHEDLRSSRFTSPIRHHPYARIQTSPLSSPSSSEDEGEDEGSPQESSATPTPASEQQARRIRIPRLKGAGRHPLRDLLRWEAQRLDAVKVRLPHKLPAPLLISS